MTNDLFFGFGETTFRSLAGPGHRGLSVRNYPYADASDENIDGTSASDTLRGAGGNDIIRGLAGSDLLYGDGGNDFLVGHRGDDALFGGDGDDILHGGPGSDYLSGGFGNDTYRIIDPLDTLYERPGQGIDTLVAQGVEGIALPAHFEILRLIDTSRGYGNALDNILYAAPVATTRLEGRGGDDVIHGASGEDVLVGGHGHDIVYGNLGEDELYGQGGDDQLYGGSDFDRLDGGRGDDWLDGGSGADWLFGGDESDMLLGGDGDDTMQGQSGDDTLVGGRGSDIFNGGSGADLFVFRPDDVVDNYWQDFIWDFSQTQGDRIDLSAIDAIAGGTDDAFTFIGDQAFSNTPGELRFYHFEDRTVVLWDINGNGAAEYVFAMRGNIDLTADDFIL